MGWVQLWGSNRKNPVGIQWVPFYSSNHGPWTHEGQIQIPIPNRYLGFGYKGLVFCRNNGSLMENNKLVVPKSVLINRPKIPQKSQKLCAQKFAILMKKGFIGRP